MVAKTPNGPSRRRSRFRKSLSLLALTGGPGGTRTHDPLIKSRGRAFLAIVAASETPI